MDAFVSIELVITVYCHGESLCPVWSLKLEIVVAQKNKFLGPPFLEKALQCCTFTSQSKKKAIQIIKYIPCLPSIGLFI